MDGGKGVTIHPCWVWRDCRVAYLSSLHVVATSRNLMLPYVNCWICNLVLGWGWKGAEKSVGRLLYIGCPVVGKLGICILVCSICMVVAMMG